MLQDYLAGKKVEKEIKLDTILVTKYNVLDDINFINQNVFGR